jgi:hypothetical protein
MELKRKWQKILACAMILYDRQLFGQLHEGEEEIENSGAPQWIRVI